MISFVKSNSTIFVPILILFLTIDIFLLIFKFKNYLESIINLKISYDTFKSYYLDFYSYDKYTLAIIYLTVENTSTNSTDITKIQLIDGSKSYFATLLDIKDDCNKNGIVLINEDEDETQFININILSENILNNTKLPPNDAIKGYAVFKNVEPIANTKNYKIIIETHNKTFEKEITINKRNDGFHPINH